MSILAFFNGSCNYIPMDKPERIQQLKKWYLDTPGEQLAAFESYYINHALHTLFGYHLLHLGDLGSRDWLDGTAIRYPCCIAESGEGLPLMTTVRSDYDALPIQESSVDIVLLPHILEFETDPQAVLKEVWRVLVPHGYTIILGFNPSSLLGMSRTCPLREAHFHSIFQMRHLLNDQDFELLDVKTFFFRPPLHNTDWLSKLRFLEILGQFFWAYGGGVYLMVAQKKVLGVTPLQLSWRERWAKIGQLCPEPVARYK